MDILQQVVYKTRYAKWLQDEKRRENWEETVERYMQAINHKAHEKGYSFTLDEYNELAGAITRMEVMPSMRMMMTAGPALERDNIAAYNCAYLAIKSKRDFSEALYILMNGTGVGFSCERQYVNQLPKIPDILEPSTDIIVVQDSKLGWAKAYNKLINSLYEGDIPKIDYSKIRPAGARLRTFGGRASGPDPLRALFEFTCRVFSAGCGRKLSSIEVHDILCTIGEVVVVGGVRRSALISLSNLTDRRMREAKVGAWWTENKQRALANNSVVYTEKPDSETFLDEFLSLIKSKSGERGIFNRVAARRQASRYGKRPENLDYGCNPCSEIILRDKQFCNLTEVVVRHIDTRDDIRRKIKLATVLGTIQACFTDFGFISDEWTTNCEEERLLGVSLTGIYDNSDICKSLTSGDKESLGRVLQEFRKVANDTNKEWAAKLSIPTSAAITCIKPSGTVSQLVDSSSGIHPRFAKFYIRNVRMDIKDPICAFLKQNNIPNEPDRNFPDSQLVFSFPCCSPDSAVTRADISALEHLNLWKIYQDDFCEHKPSVTISVKPSEWPSVAAWTYENFDTCSGISFLPYSDHNYVQAPYIEITREEYEKMAKDFPKELKWELLVEDHDETTASQELACTGGSCEI